ncbi:hypothetical protein CONPUDRAFT_66444 [Coniophora puteana RWD-64-598 SS2]|uniref:Uncharacterized protein n=1 Tax=Coniophora puteana (strain RWD-64-598) TaxID=741705 RepID=A0A5M3M8K6_CONPW|nr:uncharacterized protein CONPUDRAFT_66444 [Coniophora puteana RWD-64-598 SS2]EIW75115.1 hypothetical protein CONPUDRAFT_66444 [Coniophora puteana RWD-64-598 SS2]
MALTIDHPTRKLSCSTPHLLPFHIDYTGPANISTYFRIREAGATVGTSQSLIDKSTTIVASESQTDGIDTSTAASAVTLVDSDSQPPAPSTSTTPPSDTPLAQPPNAADTTKLLAAFRGRHLVGKRVTLPEGYAGLILRTPEKSLGKSTSTAPTSSKGRAAAEKEVRESRGGRPSRRGKSKHFPVEVEDDDMDGHDATGSLEEGAEDVDDEQDVRRLEPTARFDSFVLWNPDLPPDGGRDEYLRTLSEWVSLAREVSGFLCLEGESEWPGRCCSEFLFLSLAWRRCRVDRSKDFAA